jgi:hypothetical protein
MEQFQIPPFSENHNKDLYIIVAFVLSSAFGISGNYVTIGIFMLVFFFCRFIYEFCVF